MTLSETEVGRVRRSWDLLKGDPQTVGTLLFTVMFSQIPEYEELFAAMKEDGKPLLESQRFLRHATQRVVGAIDKMMTLLDCEELRGFLRSLGRNHAPRGLTARHFQMIVDILLETLRRGLGEELDGETARCWEKMLLINMTVMGEACDTQH